jgi:hypothetical protein
MAEGVQGFRLSPLQRRFWRLDQVAPMAPARAAVRIDGELPAARLRAALAAAVARHESLRTTFHRRPGMRWPIQTVGEGAPLLWREVDLGGCDAADREARLATLTAEEDTRRFDLEHGPVLAAAWVDLGGGDSRLLLTLAGICGDARSLENLVAELAAELSGAAPSTPEVQYLDFSEWLNEQLGAKGEEALSEP